MNHPRFAAVIRQIESRSDRPAREESFRRFKRALARYPVVYSPTVTIAGTNGKGTVAKMLESAFNSRGENVGLFTSPHLIKTTERIRTANTDLTEAEFVAAFERIESLHNTFMLSHFETLTLMMIEVFYGGSIRKRVDRAILEVGVGGRWDPVRAIPHQVSVITKLGMDHEAILGRSLREIAEHKFGIVTEGNIVVHADLDPQIQDFSRVSVAPLPFTIREGPTWWVEGRGPLKALGARAVENASIALKVLDEMGLRTVETELAVLNTVWPGRMEEFAIRGRRVFLSGDHNVDGIATLAEILAAFEYDSVFLVIGIGKNKTAEPMLEKFAAIRGAKLVLTNTPFRSAGLGAYGDYRKKAQAEFDVCEEALEYAIRAAGPRDLIVVTGSLYLVGHLRKILV